MHSSTISYTAVTGAHVPVLAALETAVFPTPELGEEGFAKLLALPTVSGFIAAENRNNPCGFMLLQQTDNNVYDVITLGVLPAMRRIGVARTLLTHAAAQGGTLMLEVRRSNHGAQALYRKLGAKQVGLRKGYYQNPTEDGLLLALSLPPNP